MDRNDLEASYRLHCTKVSEGRRHCYAERMAVRLRAMGNCRYVNGFGVTLHDDLVDLPRHLRQPRLIFVNSMSDLFSHHAYAGSGSGQIREIA
jgi:protein gp37